MILVTGATGHVGRELVTLLLQRGAQVRALTRRPDAAQLPAGVEVVGGDFDDAGSLGAALAGVTRLFLLTTQSPGSAARPTHDLGAVAAARAAGVGHVVKLSVLGGGGDPAPGADPDPIITWHQQAEAAVRESGIAWTLLRPGRFMSNALAWAPLIRRGGPVPLSFPDRPAASIDPYDIAAVAAHALTEDGHGGHAYELSGPESLTPVDELARLGAVLGRALEPLRLDAEAARAGLGRAGLSPAVIDAIVRRAASDHGTHVLPTVAAVTGRPARSFTEWARHHAAAFR